MSLPLAERPLNPQFDTARADRPTGRRIAFLLPSLRCGGAERVVVNLLTGLAGRRHDWDLVVGSATGPLRQDLPADVRLIDLGGHRMRQCLGPLVRYLRQTQPAALVSHMNHVNVAAAAAVRLARTFTATVFVEHNTLSARPPHGLRGRLWRHIMRRTYRAADRLVAVSDGVARDLERELHLAPGRVATVYNPVVTAELHRAAEHEPDHPWFRNQQRPVFVAIVSLTAQKDFTNLLRAMRHLTRQLPARLVILGEGPLRDDLERARRELGLTDCVDLPGFCANPYAFLAHASGFVLSSRFEGLPTVLIEALACGCPVVATDCPSGPREILDGGEYGLLVPVADSGALAEAMRHLAVSAPDRDRLRRLSDCSSTARAVRTYEHLLSPWLPPACSFDRTPFDAGPVTKPSRNGISS